MDRCPTSWKQLRSSLYTVALLVRLFVATIVESYQSFNQGTVCLLHGVSLAKMRGKR